MATPPLWSCEFTLLDSAGCGLPAMFNRVPVSVLTSWWYQSTPSTASSAWCSCVPESGSHLASISRCSSTICGGTVPQQLSDSLCVEPTSQNPLLFSGSFIGQPTDRKWCTIRSAWWTPTSSTTARRSLGASWASTCSLSSITCTGE